VGDPIHQHLAIAGAAYRRFADRVRDVDPARPTRLAGWSVGDLTEHVAWAAAMESAAIGVASGSPANEVSGHGIDAAVAAFERIVDRPVGADVSVTVPAGTVPAPFAAALFAFEAALHASDLEHAVGGDPSLRPEEVEACAVVMGPMLDLLGTQIPGDDVTIDLIGIGDGIRLVADRRNRTWRRDIPDATAADTTIAGRAEDLVLFLCGRTDASSVRVDGDRDLADRFKNYFPGP